MPYGVPFSDQERGRLERLTATGDRIADCMLRHDVYFPEALDLLAGRWEPDDSAQRGPG